MREWDTASGATDPEQLQPVSIAESLTEDPGHALNSETGWRYIGVRSDFYLCAIVPAPGTTLPKGTTIGFRAAKLKDSAVPGAWFEVTVDGRAERIKVLRATLAEGRGAPGEVLDAQALTIACGAGAVRLLEVQRAGKRPVSAADFLRGLPLPAGTRLA